MKALDFASPGGSLPETFFNLLCKKMIHSQVMMGHDIQPPRTAVLQAFVPALLPLGLPVLSVSLHNTELYWDLME